MIGNPTTEILWRVVGIGKAHYVVFFFRFKAECKLRVYNIVSNFDKSVWCVYFSLHQSDSDSGLDCAPFFMSGYEILLIYSTCSSCKCDISCFSIFKHICFFCRVCSVLNGKGKASNNRFQAKVENLGSRAQAEDLLKQALSTPDIDV